MASRSNPFEEIERFFERMSHEFEDAARTYREGGKFGLVETPLAMDVADHDTEFVVTVDIPGYERDDIDVDVTDHTLHIHADREAESEEEAENYIRRERRQQALDRSIRLPDAVDADAVTAKLQNGILTITLPKTEPTRAHKHIDIE